MDRWQRDPAMHIYHYAPYEPTAIKRLAGRHGTCVDEVDELLRAGIFVDLYRVVRQSLRASVESYSIKRLEPLYGFSRAVPLREANVALNTFEAALALGGQREIESLLKTIKGYNQDDCVSTLRLRDWLEALRTEHEARTGQAIPRPEIEVRQAGFGSCGPTRRSERREGPPNLRPSRRRGRVDGRTTSTMAACSNAGMAQTRREICLVGILPAL